MDYTQLWICEFSAEILPIFHDCEMSIKKKKIEGIRKNNFFLRILVERYLEPKLLTISIKIVNHFVPTKYLHFVGSVFISVVELNIKWMNIQRMFGIINFIFLSQIVYYYDQYSLSNEEKNKQMSNSRKVHTHSVLYIPYLETPWNFRQF